jgi:hypothetical protein
VRYFAALFLSVAAVSWAADTRAADYARALNEAGLDPDACYRVRDLAFQREDLRFYLTDGYLIFARRVDGEIHGALFSADVAGGDAEVLLFPPHRSERLSLASFARTPNLNEHFTAAVFVFTDDTAEELQTKIQTGNPKPAPEIGTVLAQKYSETLRNLTRSYEIRLVQDRFSVNRKEVGFFYGALNGRTLSTFDVLYDPRQRDGIVTGQLVYRDNRRFFDTWTAFATRSIRMGQRQRPSATVEVQDVRIEATLQPPDLHIDAVTTMKVRARGDSDTALPFVLSSRMRVKEAQLDGTAVEVFARESMRANLAHDGNATFLVMLPKPLVKGESHTLTISHEGDVVTPAGNGVYFVGARTSWYPSRDAEFANYELIFRHPKDLGLVATGELVSETTEGEWRTATHRPSSPIRFAGFNLGDYSKVKSTKSGVGIEVCANRKFEVALQPRRDTMLIPPPAPFPSRRRQTEVLPMPSPPPAPNPASRLQDLSTDIGMAVEFMASFLGPPPLKMLAVAPIPGMFGQGFPGLVYLSTLAYLNPSERPGGLQTQYQRAFFSELLHAHEVAHQWWGNLVTSGSYQDEWLMEALANYSAMMALEKRKGRRALDSVLNEYRDNLLTEAGGKTLESAGPIIWGTRLINSQTPNAWRVITYEKGSWILHMLRMRMGDARFLGLLGALVKQKRYQRLSTEEFQQLAASFLPPRSEDPKLEGFFDQWVYGTGIPTLKFSYTVRGKAPRVRVRATVTQSDVDDEFSAYVPVDIQLPGRKTVTHWLRTASEPMPITIEVKQTPLKVTFDPANAILARK